MKIFSLVFLFVISITCAYGASDILGGLVNETEVILNSLLASMTSNATNMTMPLITSVANATIKTENVTNATTSLNSTKLNETIAVVVSNASSTVQNLTSGNESTKCNSSLKCVLHPKDIDNKDAFPTYNLSFLSDTCQKTCLNSKNCIYMTTIQLEDLIRTGQLAGLQADCLNSIPISIWKNVPSELIDLEFSKHQYVLQSWLNSSNSSNIGLESFVPKLVQLPRVRKALFSSNLEGLDSRLCQYVQIKDFCNVSQLSDASFNCMKIMLNDSGKCLAIPENFFDPPSNVTANATWSVNLDIVMDHIREAITLECFQKMNPKVQKAIGSYVKSSGKLGSFNAEIANYLKSMELGETVKPLQTNITTNSTSNNSTTRANSTNSTDPILSTGIPNVAPFVSLFDVNDGYSIEFHPLISIFSIAITFYSLTI